MIVPSSESPRYDALYLSPHADDAALACAGRMHTERARGEKALVLVLFDADVEVAAAALDEWGVDVATVGLDRSARRRADVGYRSLAFERLPEDTEVLERVLRNDPSVCETPNPIAFAKLHGLLMVHLALWKQSADALGEAQKAQIEAQIIERLRKWFPEIADEWPHAS
jgi:LmbE family N-acetylglucosaminyl deacetylase